MLGFDPTIVVDLLLDDSLLEHFELVRKQLILCLNSGLVPILRILVIHLPHLLRLFFPLVFPHGVVPKFRDNFEHHIPDVRNLRGVEPGALLNLQVRRVKPNCGQIARSCVAVKAYLVTILQEILFHLDSNDLLFNIN